MSVRLPPHFQRALKVIARRETERQGVLITPTDVACLAIDHFIGMFLGQYPDAVDEMCTARELSAEQTEALKAQLQIELSKVLARQ